MMNEARAKKRMMALSPRRSSGCAKISTLRWSSTSRSLAATKEILDERGIPYENEIEARQIMEGLLIQSLKATQARAQSVGKIAGPDSDDDGEEREGLRV